MKNNKYNLVYLFLIVLFCFEYNISNVEIPVKQINSAGVCFAVAQETDEPLEEWLLNNTNDIKADSYYVEGAIKNYLYNMIDAINTNDFRRVEKYLYPNSNLYKSQKNLVYNLYKKKIKEKLLEYRVEDTVLASDNGTYKAFVYEKISIEYPNNLKPKVTEYYWEYTVKTYNNPKNQNTEYRLSDIAKWDGKIKR